MLGGSGGVGAAAFFAVLVCFGGGDAALVSAGLAVGFSFHAALALFRSGIFGSVGREGERGRDEGRDDEQDLGGLHGVFIFGCGGLIGAGGGNRTLLSCLGSTHITDILRPPLWRTPLK